MTPLRQKMIEDIQLRGLAEKTQDSYVRAVRQLAEYYDKSPEYISEEEVEPTFCTRRMRNRSQSASGWWT